MKPVFGHGRYANVTATVALVVALSGTSYAAMTLPANSVGSRQIKSRAVTNSDIRGNAVTSSKVRNGSLRARDFGAGQLPAGPRGATGAQGQKGDKGDLGPSDAFQVSRNAISPPVIPAGTTTNLLSLPLAAGKYVLFAKLDMDATAGPHTVTCRLQAGSASDKVLTTIDGVGGYSCNMQTVHEFAAAGAATLTIETPAGSTVRGGDAKITAIRVGSLQSSEVTP
jgi:hypothetical protein